MVGVRFRRSLFPGFSDTAEYSFRCPGSAASEKEPTGYERTFRVPVRGGPPTSLRVTARLMYRKIDQYLLNFMFGEKAGLTAPATEMSRSEATIRVLGPGAKAEIGPPRAPADRRAEAAPPRAAPPGASPAGSR
jgi:hypothetical protein